jgi:hypothetical protein
MKPGALEEMAGPTIFHGTPLTPRAALEALLVYRAACVSFWRPDDAEVVGAICSAVMFRQRRVLRVDRRYEARRAMVHPRGLDAILRLGRVATGPAGQVGGDPRRAWRAFPAQRQPAQHAAVGPGEVGAALAHGRADRAPDQALRAVRAGLLGLDRHWSRCRGGLRGVVAANGRGRRGARQSLAQPSPHARRARRAGVPLHQRGRHQRRAERITL